MAEDEAIAEDEEGKSSPLLGLVPQVLWMNARAAIVGLSAMKII